MTMTFTRIFITALVFLISNNILLYAQVVNDECITATVIDGVTSDFPFVCMESTNLDALPETFNNACGVGDFPTVWFVITTDGNASLLNIHVQSEEFSTPTISLFLPNTTCTNLQPIGLTQSNLPCIIGSGGEAEAVGTDIGANQTYYIAIGSLYSEGGQFELCINTISTSSACVTSRDIEIISRSESGPLSGPFFPGETVGVCMNVNSFTAAGNGCQWFQGIVPVFGNGWDPASFDGDGQPLNVTVNGNPMGVPGNGIYDASTFDWFNDVGYHFQNPFYQIGDFDANGTLDMCHILYEADCPDLGGIIGGCCGPCWDDPGDILPPGWFSYGINGTCEFPGPPVKNDWGDGNTCGCCMGPWSFCFELIVREFPSCAEDPTTRDLSLGFFTFADGETGSWTGGASVCALDQPAKISLPFCCGSFDDEDEIYPAMCGSGIFEVILDHPAVEYWTWIVDAGAVTGASEGAGNTGTVVMDTLVNPTNFTETVFYSFIGFSGGGCPVFEYNISVEVTAAMEVSLSAPVICTGTPTNYTITSFVEGGSGNYEYLWLPGMFTTPDIIIQNPVEGSQYTLIVSDGDACVDTATITINFESSLNVNIQSPVLVQCIENGPVTFNGEASGGTAPYQYEWTLPDGTLIQGQMINADSSGEYHLLVTDSTGCTGSDSITITFFSSPEVNIDSGGENEICAGDSLTLNALVAGGQPPFVLIWNTPGGADTAQTIEAAEAGIYQLTVEDSNGCEDTAAFTLMVNDAPAINAGLLNSEICAGDTTIFNPTLTGGEAPFQFMWNTPTGPDTSQSLIAFTAGTYTLTVTDNNACTGTAQDSLLVHELPSVTLDIPDLEICEGDSILVNAIISGGNPPFEILWDTPGSPDTSTYILAFTEGQYSIQIEDANGCNDSAGFNLQVHNLPSLDLGQDTILTNVPVTLDAGTGWVSHLWNTGESTQLIQVDFTGEYHVTVLDSNDCSASDTVYVEFITHVINIHDSGILHIYPNPNRGTFKLSGEIQSGEELTIEIFSLAGVKIFHSKPEKMKERLEKEIVLGEVDSGIYLVRIKLGLNEYIGKVVVE
jgi:hypothetical protein